MFPPHVHLKAKCWHPALHCRLQGRLPLAWVYCFSKIWCSREWFIFLCKKHVCLFRWKKIQWAIRSCQQIFFGAPWIAFSFMHPPPKEFGAMLNDWLVRTLQCNPPFSTFLRSPMNCVFIHASFTQRVWSYASWLTSEDPLVQSSILAFFSEPD